MRLIPWGLAFLLSATALAAPSPRLSPVPLLVGMDVNDPKIQSQHLKEGAFRLAVNKREKNAKVPKGKIIRQEPAAGSVMKSQSTISVTISDGR